MPVARGPYPWRETFDQGWDTWRPTSPRPTSSGVAADARAVRGARARGHRAPVHRRVLGQPRRRHVPLRRLRRRAVRLRHQVRLRHRVAELHRAGGRRGGRAARGRATGWRAPRSSAARCGGHLGHVFDDGPRDRGACATASTPAPWTWRRGTDAVSGADGREASAALTPAIEVPGPQRRPSARSRPSAASASRSRRARCSASSGPNGAGKTTTINMLCTLVEADRRQRAGRRPRRRSRERDDVRRHIGLVFQDQTLDGYLTPSRTCASTPSSTASSRALVPARMRQVMEMVGLWERRDVAGADVLGRHAAPAGDRARPDALPARAVPRRADGRARPADAQLDLALHPRAASRREEITIFMTTHYMDEAEYCDRIAIIDRGEIVALDTPAALKASVGADRVRIQTEDDEAAIAALAERFGLEARDGGGRGHVLRALRRGVRPAPVRRARRADPLASASRGRRSTTCSCPTPARRSATPRSRSPRQRNRDRGAGDDGSAAMTAHRTRAGRPRSSASASRRARWRSELRAIKIVWHARADPLRAATACGSSPRSCSRCSSCSCSAPACSSCPARAPTAST